MAAAAAAPAPIIQPAELFQAKYTEFCGDLEVACPELAPAIQKARALDPSNRVKRYKSEVKTAFQKKTGECPGCVLPGVILTETVWNELTEQSRKGIHDYCLVLSVCIFYLSMPEGTPAAAAAATAGGMDEGFLGLLKEKFANLDVGKLTDLFSKLFTGGESGTASATAAASAEFFAHLSERFLKGKIAKMAEELVAEFSPEDVGLTAEQLAECEKDPTKAFSILSEAFTSKPEIFQKAVMKIGNRMKQKIERGELRPQELAAEAQELIEECKGNPAFRDMLETLKSAFGFEDMDMARAQGREGSARLALVRNRLRAKLEKKKNSKE